ncbi:MAG: hypothetical protein Kow0073_13180 [Immundisolibacter sp.]
MAALDVAEQPFPQRERLGVRVVDAKDAHPLPEPEVGDAQQLPPQGLPILGLEVEPVDVLVFLGRVLRALHGAVRPPAEPGRVLARVGMVRRALEGQIHGQFEAVLAGPHQQAADVVQRAQLRMDGAVAGAQQAAQHVVTVAEDVRLHLHRLAEHALDGEAPAVDARRHALDDHPLTALDRDGRHGGGIGARGCGHQAQPPSTGFRYSTPSGGNTSDSDW